MAGEPLRVLLIQSWVIPGAEVRTALTAAGFEPRIFRVDHEPALVAALTRAIYDVVILDARSGLSRAEVEPLLRSSPVRGPLVEYFVDQPLGASVRAATSRCASI